MDVPIEVLYERMQNYKDQVMHLIALYESEQRVTGNISKRTEDNNYAIKSIDEIVKKHERIILNEGKGISYRIDRIEQWQKHKQSSLSTWISILSFLSSIGAILVTIFK